MAGKCVPIELRLEKHSIPEPNSGCWIWLAATVENPYSGLYGVIGGDKRISPQKMLLAHRASYMVHKGNIPEGFDIDHVCQNTLCINPDHLEPVTKKEHSKRTNERGLKGRCRRGHLMDENNTWVEKNGRPHCRRCHADREVGNRRMRWYGKTLETTKSCS